MILLPFRTIFRSGNTFLLSPIGWPSHMHSRVTLKLKVTSWSTWPLLSLLVFDLSQWFFCCFVRILGQEIHSNYRRSRDLNAWPWNWMSRHVYVTYVIFACICATAKIFLVLQRFWVREFILTIVTCVPFTYDLETQGHVMVYVTFVISGHAVGLIRAEIKKSRRPWHDLQFQGHA